jgi:hypothetical protein
MRNTVIILGIICIVLLGSLHRCRRAAQREGQTFIQESQSFSNKLVEIQTRLFMNQAMAAEAQTNLQSQLDQWRNHATILSNRLLRASQAALLLQQEAQLRQADLDQQKTSLAQQETELLVLRERTEQFQSLGKELAEVKARMASVVSERDTAVREAGRLQVEKADLERQQQDPVFLRRQIAQVEEETKCRQRLAASVSRNRQERHAPLVLQADGTVKPALSHP